MLTKSFNLGYAKRPGSLRLRAVDVELDQLWSLHVIGSPGEGKSTFLGRLAEACIAEGEGVLLIDPKGDLARDVALKTEHPDKLIYIAPGAYPDHVFPLNVMEVDRSHPFANSLINVVASNVVSLFAHMGRYDATIMRLVGKYLDAAAQLVYALPQPTLRDVVLLFIDKHFRKEIQSQSRRPDLKWFWDYFDDWSQRDQRVQVDTTLSRLWDFLTSEALSLMIASPTSKLHFGDWLNQGKLIVVNLANKFGYEDSVRIGNLLVGHVTTLYSFRESELYPNWDRTRRWRLIVDEFHELSPAPIARIIRNGRSFNFFPVVAHQDTGQLRRLDKDSDIPFALGHHSQLAFRRSTGDMPSTSYQAQEEFVKAEAEKKQYEADWTFRSPTGTTKTLVQMADWKAAAKPEQLVAAMDQALEYTLPKSKIPKLSERYEAWRQGGTMEDDAKPTKGKTTRQNPLPPRGKDRPDDQDSARVPNDGAARPTRLIDFIPGGEDLLLGRDDDEGTDSSPPPRRGRKSRQ